MRLGKLLTVSMSGGVATPEYWEKVRDLRPANLIQYLRYNDTSGTQATDYSGANRHGVYTNSPTLANAAGPDGVLVPYFDGVNQCVDLDYPTNTINNTIAPPAKGSVMEWAKVPEGVWEDGTIDVIVSIGYNSNNEIHIKKSNVNPTWGISWIRSPNSSQQSLDHFDYTPLTWFMVGMAWDDTVHQFRAYVYDAAGGFQVVGTCNYETEWAGLDYRASWGAAFLNAGASTFKGWLAHHAFWNDVLTQDEFEVLATV